MSQLFFSYDEQQARQFARKVEAGELTRLRQSIFTDAKGAEIERVVYNRWHEIVDFLYPQAIASYRTAASLSPYDGVVFITAPIKKRRQVNIADVLTIEVLPGNVDLLTEPFIPHLFRSGRARNLLENLTTSHKDAKVTKALGVEWVEQELVKLLACYGEDELNVIRDEARAAAKTLGFKKQAKQLELLIGALLTTHSIDHLSSAEAIAMARP